MKEWIVRIFAIILAISLFVVPIASLIWLLESERRTEEKRTEVKQQEEKKIMASLPSPKFSSGDVVYCKIDTNRTRRGMVMRCLYNENTKLVDIDGFKDIPIQVFLPYFYRVKFFSIPEGTTDISIATSQSISSANASLLGGHSQSSGYPNEIKMFNVEVMREDEIEK